MVVAPILALAGESWRWCSRRRSKRALMLFDVVVGIGVEDDDVVEIRGDEFQAFDDLVDNLDEPAGGGAAALRHNKPLE